MLAGQPIALPQPIDDCVVPSGMPDGPVFVFITDDIQPLASNVVVQNAGQIKAGPTIAFLDQQADAFGALVRNTGKGAPPQGADGSNSDLKVLGMSKQ